MNKKIDGIIAKNILSYKIGDFESFINYFYHFVKYRKEINEEIQDVSKKFNFKMFHSLTNKDNEGDRS